MWLNVVKNLTKYLFFSKLQISHRIGWCGNHRLRIWRMVGWIICITAEKERKTLELFFYELLRFLGLNNFKIKALRQLVVSRLFKEKSQECHITMCNYFCLKSTFIRASASCVPKLCRFMLFLSTTSNVQNNPLLDNLTNHFNIHLYDLSSPTFE